MYQLLKLNDDDDDDNDDADAVTMATNTVLLRLVLVMTLTTTTTLAGKGFRLRTLAIQQRARGYSPAARMTDVLDRLDQLTALVNDLQAVSYTHLTLPTILRV